MNEVTLNVRVTGGKQLSVLKEGSQLVAKVLFGATSLDSQTVGGTPTPSDYDLRIDGNLTGCGDQFIEQMVRYPLLVKLDEIFAKDKKQKEDKIITHAVFAMDLVTFLTGTTKIEKSFSAISTELTSLTVEFDVCVEIEKICSPRFLSEDYRILTIKLINGGNIPDTWVGSNFTATIPIPKENNETTAVNFVGKSEQTQIENSVNLIWQTPDGGTCLKPNGTCVFEKSENQNGEKIEQIKSGPMINWNSERRLLMKKEDSEIFQTRIAKFSAFLPIEIARARETEGVKKGKAKQEDNDLQNHGIALVNLSPLLYPGVSEIKGVFHIQGYTDHVLSASGYGSSIIEEVNRSGSIVNIDQRVRSAKTRTSNASDISNEKKPHVPIDALPYNELQSSVYFEFSLSRPFVERRKLSDLCENLSRIIPKRETLPRKKFGAQAAVTEYHDVIADIGRRVLADMRSFRKIPSEEVSFHESLIYKMNKTGQYNEYHEQLKHAVIRIVREKYIKTNSFSSDEEFKTFLELLYVFLIKEMHKSLNKTVVQDAPAEPAKVATINELQNAALFAEKMEDYDKANYLWTELLARDDSSPVSWQGLARAALMIDDIDRAHEALQQAVSLSHTDPWTMILAAMVAKQRGDLYTTKILLARASANPDSEDQTVAEENPTNALERSLAFILLSNIYEDELDLQLAKFSKLQAERTQKHIKMDEPGCGIYLLGAEMFEKSSLRGFSQQMLAQYISSVDVGVELPGRALVLKSKLEMQSENYENALKTILKATETDHSNSSVWAQFGRILLKLGKTDEAKNALIRSVAYHEQPTDSIIVFIRLARILEGENNYQEARQYYLMACETCPTSTSWFGVGMCSLRLGELREAEDALAEANLLDPRNAEVWGYLSLLCLKSGRKLEAEQSFKFACKLKLSNEALFAEIRQAQQVAGFGDPNF